MNENTILKSVPAAGALRKVPGFDPLKHLRTTTSHKTGEKVLKLDLPFKKLWFRLACPNGRMLLKPLRITDQMAIFEAKVFLRNPDLSIQEISEILSFADQSTFGKFFKRHSGVSPANYRKGKQ